MGCIDGSQVRGRGSAGPWQASLGPASGASHASRMVATVDGLEANLNYGGPL